MATPTPILFTDRQLLGLLFRPKPIAEVAWRGHLVPKAIAADPANRRGAYEFADWDGDEWLVYTRESLRNAGNWSAGLIYDPAGLNLRFVRCNGPHASVHQNRLDPGDPPIVVTPHVHYVRQKYLQHPRTKEDGYAVPCIAFTDLDGAIEHLATVTNFVPDGRLIL